MFYTSIAAVIISNVVYHIAQKSIPQGVNPFVSTAVSYIVALVLCVAAYFLFPAQEPLSVALGRVNWSSYLLGFAILGVEVAYIFVYRSGWELNLASLVAGVAIALLLVPIGVFAFHEQLSLKTIIGIMLCLAGLTLISSR